jgi:hypothetical protein
MLVFIILTVAGVGGIVAWRSSLRYRASRTAEEKSKRPGLKNIFIKSSWKKTLDTLKSWAEPRYPRWTIGILIALGASLVYQIASGFFFAVFIRRGLFGFPLLGHVASGALFALALSFLLLWRGRDFKLDSMETPGREQIIKPPVPKITDAGLRKTLFWTFAFFGLIQMTTALGSMLPFFHYDAQRVFITTHRYGALGILLTVIVFIDMTFIPNRQS